MQFPLAMQVAIRDEKSTELGTTHFSCANFLRRRLLLSFTLARPCFPNMDSWRLTNWIGPGWDGFKQSEVPAAEKLAK